MPAGVFVMLDDETLRPLEPAQFALEEDFQTLIARFPELLAGDQIDVAAPRRFLLIEREQPIGLALDLPRWSIDHLFLDQDGVPTLVEVKRQTDTRLRREVVGQMMDYAANCVGFWPVETLRSSFELRCAREGVDPEILLAGHLAGALTAEVFWRKVSDNLSAGRLRLLFVADLIPLELRRVIEFLNTQMQPAEVLGVELRQYADDALKALAPVVHGRTEAARRRGEGGQDRSSLDAPDLIAAIAERAGLQAAEAAREILHWSAERCNRLQTNAGTVPTMGPVFASTGGEVFPFLVGADGVLTLYFGMLSGHPVYGDLAARQAWLRDLNAVPGIDLAEDALVRRPRLQLERFTPPTARGFIAAMEGFVGRLQQSGA